MHHNVLDLREVCFNGIVHDLCCFVCLFQRFLRIGGNFHIDIDFIAKFARAQHIQTQHARLLLNAGAHFLFQFRLAGMIHHLIGGIQKNLRGCLCDKHTNDQAGNRIQHRIAHACTKDAEQGADRGQRIRTMMPCIRHQCRRINLLCIPARVLIHRLFEYNRNNGCNLCQNTRNRQRLIIAGHNIFDRFQADAETGRKQNAR